MDGGFATEEPARVDERNCDRSNRIDLDFVVENQMGPIQDDAGNEANLTAVAAALRLARRVAVLSGAGISAESGVPTFRGAGGLWRGRRAEEVATPTAFGRDPELVWAFYNERRAALREVRPNPGHLAIVAMEERFGEGNFTLVTQNVDGLHTAAGSRRVLEIHGNIRRVRCTACGQVTDRGLEPLAELPKCDGCAALLRPDVVWFEEMLPEAIWGEAVAAVERCDILLVVGTSAVVYPAARLVPVALSLGATVIEVNPEPALGLEGVVRLQGKSGELLPELVRRL
jgi:NAD-dependent deacetylase